MQAVLGFRLPLCLLLMPRSPDRLVRSQRLVRGHLSTAAFHSAPLRLTTLSTSSIPNSLLANLLHPSGCPSKPLKFDTQAGFLFSSKPPPYLDKRHRLSPRCWCQKPVGVDTSLLLPPPTTKAAQFYVLSLHPA